MSLKALLALLLLLATGSCTGILGIGPPGAEVDDGGAGVDGAAPDDGAPADAPGNVHVTGSITSLGGTAAGNEFRLVDQRLEAQQRVCTATAPKTCVTAGITP
jgi:hypothetical protein